jgi:hypothetical protein
MTIRGLTMGDADAAYAADPSSTSAPEATWVGSKWGSGTAVEN